ncbi:MAG TPA: hydrogenase 4 subunit B [Rhodopila sp.]|uniref:hydrogenase 4 subunit B n=1 Tax=Rhodopila sp. TaxID=2480087 RepID=UPI002BD7E361|nr:hydrogenase 4 subunit B [Rhodopila sp.]HVY16886.1 hydrogenase 4 subunit B [Rhodopila sp.]
MTGLVWAAPCFLALGLVGVLRPPGSRHLVYGGCALLSLVVLGIGVGAVWGPVEHLSLPVGLPGVGSRFRLDPLSGFFLIVVGLGSAGASTFGLGYTRTDAHPERVLPFYPLFIISMVLVVVADDAFSFLFGWELMSLTSWALVSAHHLEPGNRRATFVYLLMAVFSGFTLLFAFSLMAGTQGHFTFDAMRANPVVGTWADIVLIIALIGAGAKAGLIPLHVWLPLAHPAAPSHVSALMSGVMTKVAVYAFLRLALDLVGETHASTATVVLLGGGITAMVGVLQAILDRDLKRVLAFSTIENVGIIFIGAGLTLAFRANGLMMGAALALTATLFHTLNHTVFKSLLFFGAGTVVEATGQRDIETMGGLIHRMPRTALAMLTGCVAIAGFPPLNGFVSEWLTFQAMLLRPDMPQWGLKLAFPMAGALLALTAALAAGCFVRLFGICFLGRPRSRSAAEAREADLWSTGTILAFALFCILGGVFPGAVIDAMAPISTSLLGARMPEQIGNGWLTIVPIAAGHSSYNGVLIFLFILVSALLAVAGIHRRSNAIRTAPPWDCGFPDPSPRTEYSADSFAQPIRRVFAPVLMPTREQVEMPPPGDMRPAVLHRNEGDLFWDGIYAPLGHFVEWVSGKANVLQFLTIRRYLGFVFVSLIVLLIALTVWP